MSKIEKSYTAKEIELILYLLKNVDIYEVKICKNIIDNGDSIIVNYETASSYYDSDIEYDYLYSELEIPLIAINGKFVNSKLTGNGNTWLEFKQSNNIKNLQKNIKKVQDRVNKMIIERDALQNAYNTTGGTTILKLLNGKISEVEYESKEIEGLMNKIESNQKKINAWKKIMESE